MRLLDESISTLTFPLPPELHYKEFSQKNEKFKVNPGSHFRQILGV